MNLADRPVKVLHVIRSEAWGGLELYVATLLKKLHADGQSIAVYCLTNSILGENLRKAGIEIFPARKRFKYSLTDIWAIRTLLIKEGYSIVHSHTNSDALSCSLAIIGVTTCKHIFGLYLSTCPKRDFFHRLLYRNIDFLCSTSALINEEVRKNYPITPGKIRLLRYGREVCQYRQDIQKRNKIRARWGVTEEKIIVGTICRIDPSKGVQEFAEAYLHLPEPLKEKLVFWIVGERTILHSRADGSREFEQASDRTFQELVKFISENGLQQKIHLIPYQEDLIGYLGALDVFVQASWNEMYSLVVLEALLMRLPVIGTNTGGTPEQLAGGQGLLVPPKSPTALSGAITYMVEHHQAAAAMAAKGQTWVVREHDWSQVFPALNALYNEAANISSHSSAWN
jgi:glycosyltransferase involved in cell wall biosynthesis